MLEKRSFTLSGHRTSAALEPEFWARLMALAAQSGRTLSALVSEIDIARSPNHPLASALRVRALAESAAASLIALADEVGNDTPD